MATATSELPSCLKDFMVANGLPFDLYDVAEDTPRYFRLLRNSAKRVSEVELKQAFGGKITGVSWLPKEYFYQIPASTNLSNHPLYQDNHIIGMDAASGFAIAALDPQPGESVCEICCAPGAKTATIADRMGYKGTLVGVDISQSRLSTCAKLLKRYRVAAAAEKQKDWWCKLYLADGTTFDVGPKDSFPDSQGVCTAMWKRTHPSESMSPSAKRMRIEETKEKAQPSSSPPLLFLDSTIENSLHENQKGKLKRTDPNTARKAAKRLQAKGVATILQTEEASSVSGESAYDRVIVDAECTHDGSIRHILKYNDWGWDTFAHKVLPPDRMKDLPALQRRLLGNGYRLLKPGGVLVYSTCSLTRAQNEEVVQWLLDSFPCAYVEPIPLVKAIESSAEEGVLPPWIPTSVPNAIRFHPLHSKTSGLFVARIRKKTEEK